MRIGVISQWYPPEPEFVVSGLAAELAGRGHEVRVLTGYPNYPGGRIYPGFRQRWRGESHHGPVAVRRVPLYPSHDASALRRIGNYVSFSAMSTLAARDYLAGCEALYVYHPPATAFAAASALRLPTVLHVQDLWPESVTASPLAPAGRPGRILHRILAVTMRRLYGSAAAIAVIAPSMAERVIAGGADPRKVSVVYNWTDEELFRPVAPDPSAAALIGRQAGRPVIIHAGNIGPFQNVECAIRAAASIEHTTPIDLVFVGSGIQEQAARSLAAGLGAANIRFLGRRDPAQMAALHSVCDFALVSLTDLPIFRGTIPSKLQSALACGSPVVAAVSGDCADVVERNGAGLVCAPDDWRALAACFARAAATPAADRLEMGRRARATYLSQMSRQAGVDRIEEMLRAAAEAKPAMTSGDRR